MDVNLLSCFVNKAVVEVVVVTAILLLLLLNLVVVPAREAKWKELFQMSRVPKSKDFGDLTDLEHDILQDQIIKDEH